MHASPAGTPNAAPSGGPFMPSQSGMGGQGGSGAPGTPTRSGHGIAPNVVISPSSGNAPVRLHTGFLLELIFSHAPLQYSNGL